MRLIWLSTLFFLNPVLLPAFATSIVPWDDVQVKHSWHTVPADWENLGHPSAGTTIEIDIALKSDRESAVIDALSEISDPQHPRYVLLDTPPLAYLFTCAASPFQIPGIPFQGRA